MIRIDCYFAVLKKFKEQYMDAHFEMVMRRFGHPLSPSWNLLNQAKEMKWSFEKYTSELLEEFSKNPKAQERLKELREIARKKDVFLVCFEKDPSVCHRSIVKKILEES
jgi:uncharacterized protein YeaO (DUF488 family)